MISKLWSGKRKIRDRLNGDEVRLDEVPLDLEVEVRRIETADVPRVHRLASLGILPGARLRLVQNRSAFVAVVDREQVAFDAQVAAAVWVRGIEAAPGSR